MSLVRKLIDSAPVRTYLDFGINSNVRLVKLSNEDIMKDGMRLNKNTHMTFVKYDESNEPIAQSTFSYWDLDATKDFVRDNFVTQMGHFVTLLNLHASEDVAREFQPTEGIEDAEELMSILKNQKKCVELQHKAVDQFISLMKPYIGEDAPLLRIKIVTSPDGKYLQLPSSYQFVEPNDTPEKESILKITIKEKENYMNGFKPEQEKADNKTNKPSIDI
jgi:hypothetical protein